MEKEHWRRKEKNRKETVQRMKKIVVLINPEKKKELEQVFDTLDVGGVVITNVQGFGNQKGIVTKFRGTEVKVNYLSKVQAETVVPDYKVNELVEELMDELQTGNIGDGKIFIYNVEEAIRIRTGEKGEKAL